METFVRDQKWQKTLLTPKGDHITKEDRGEGTRWEPPTPTRSREEEPRAKEQDRPVRRLDSRLDQRKPKPTASTRGRGPRTKAKSQTHQKEGKQRHNRGLRKNTDPTWDRWPNVKTRNTTGPRNPEALQPHDSKPTSIWQRTRVTTSTAKLRRADNQGSTWTTPSHQQTLEARGKNPSKDSKKTLGVWTTKRQEPPSENQDKGESSPKIR